DQLGFTLDTYWVQMGGGNPTEWLNRLSGRVPCIHLKDLRMHGTEQRMASVGSGNLNFDSIIAAAGKAGTEYAFVEQDETYGVDPFEEAASSFKYLSAMGLN
ncbi:MAG: sugar phosphate isomerase/epimerase, partial [Firmicutes bacterium]|nr:sugar phosphate isomerase/epimerase [Candidatus Colimorpha enterica]